MYMDPAYQLANSIIHVICKTMKGDKDKPKRWPWVVFFSLLLVVSGSPFRPHAYAYGIRVSCEMGPWGDWGAAQTIAWTTNNNNNKKPGKKIYVGGLVCLFSLLFFSCIFARLIRVWVVRECAHKYIHDILVSFGCACEANIIFGLLG